MIAYEDTAAAIDWLTQAFGFTGRGKRFVMEDGTIGHAELEIGGDVVMLATPSRDDQSPKTHRESCDASTAGLRLEPLCQLPLQLGWSVAPGSPNLSPQLGDGIGIACR